VSEKFYGIVQDGMCWLQGIKTRGGNLTGVGEAYELEGESYISSEIFLL
jgi:hypothetical protein